MNTQLTEGSFLANTPVKPSPDSQIVTAVTHWADSLFSFRVSRPDSLRFRSGEFVMIGLPGPDYKPILRAYSIASPAWDEELEFYSIKVPDGPLTSRLQKIVPGDRIIVKSKPVGTLVIDALQPGKTLWMLSTGTGIAPFASLIRDPDVYERFDEIILTHTCRLDEQLAYGRTVVDQARTDPLVGDTVQEKLIYYPTTTVASSPTMGRITDRIRSHALFADLKKSPWQAETDRVMICGSLDMNKDLIALCDTYGLSEGSNNSPGHYVVERAFTG
ncbi:MAG: ferredoxin--NADP reductase [Granulosicoccus sp.]